jgi:hypothetical protein
MNFKKLFVMIIALCWSFSLVVAADRIEYKELPKKVQMVFVKAFGKDKFKFEKIYKSSRFGRSIYKVEGEYIETDEEYEIVLYEDGTIFKIDREEEDSEDE